MCSYAERVLAFAYKVNVLPRVFDPVFSTSAICEENIHQFRHCISVDHNPVEFAKLDFVVPAFLKVYSTFRQAEPRMGPAIIYA